MNSPAPEIIICKLCGQDAPLRGFDHALQGPIGTCCHADIIAASLALSDAGFETATLNPDHEK